MRRMNYPEVIHQGECEHVELLWPLYDDVYPTNVMTHLGITTHPDPFTPTSKRVCHHAAVYLFGLGMVDLGWTITGEPPPRVPFCTVTIDPVFEAELVGGFRFVPGPTRPPGVGIYGELWARLKNVICLTLVGLAYEVVRTSTAHRATMHFYEAAQKADFHACLMMRRWRDVSPIDLARIDLT